MTKNIHIDEELYTSLHKCTRCGQCTYGTGEAEFVVLCPMYKEGKFFSYSAGGLMQIARVLYEGKLDYSESLRDIVFHCTTCGVCEANCGVIDNHLEVITLIRRELRDLAGAEALKTVVEDIVEHKNPYGKRHETRNDWLAEDREVKSDEPAEILYFVGCVSAYDQRKAPGSFTDILDKAGVPFSVSDDEWCCGGPLYHSGYGDEAIRLARHNVRMIEETGVEKVVTSCPTCAMVFKKHYPVWLKRELPFTVLHATEFLEQLVDEGRLELGEVAEPTSVIYHDPCHLGRRLGVFDPPRNLLKGIGGVSVHEFSLSRENSHCCGGGGMIPIANQSFSNDVATERIEQISDDGIEMIVSACPNCRKTLHLASRKMKSGLKVVDIAELIDACL